MHGSAFRQSARDILGGIASRAPRNTNDTAACHGVAWQSYLLKVKKRNVRYAPAKRNSFAEGWASWRLVPSYLLLPPAILRFSLRPSEPLRPHARTHARPRTFLDSQRWNRSNSYLLQTFTGKFAAFLLRILRSGLVSLSRRQTLHRAYTVGPKLKARSLIHSSQSKRTSLHEKCSYCPQLTCLCRRNCRYIITPEMSPQRRGHTRRFRSHRSGTCTPASRERASGVSEGTPMPDIERVLHHSSYLEPRNRVLDPSNFT